MKKKKLYWILLGIAIFILFMGIMMAVESSPEAFMNDRAQAFFSKDWDELTPGQRNWLSERYPDLAWVVQRREQQRQWVINWIVRPALMFIVLTGAIVTSQVIWKRVVQKSEGRKKNPPRRG